MGGNVRNLIIKMNYLQVDKLIINVCLGENGSKLSKIFSVIENFCGQFPNYSRARYSIKDFKIRRNDFISIDTSLRGEKVNNVLDILLKTLEYELIDSNFCKNGGLNFGIEEYIDLGIKYDPFVGIFGLDLNILLIRVGIRLKRRKWSPRSVGLKQVVSTKKTKLWFNTFYDGIVICSCKNFLL